MHHPKVLERVDSPEQTFHRSFSLGAPDCTATPKLNILLHETAGFYHRKTANKGTDHIF